MSAYFLTGLDLQNKISMILLGSDIRCAVAFWGNGAAQFLFSSQTARINDARIMCDISMGATNPNELRALGAPNNTGLKHLKNLHAKVYLSGQGVVITSANASSNGIGFGPPADLIEAGSFHAVDSVAYKAAAKWFEQIWRRSQKVDDQALSEAEVRWNRRSHGQRRIDDKPLDNLDSSLLSIVCTDPDKFRGVGFVFSSTTPDVEDRDNAASNLIEEDNSREVPTLSNEERSRIKHWRPDDICSNWSEEDINAWPRHFIIAYQGPRGGLSYEFYQREYAIIVENGLGTVLASKRRELFLDKGFQHPPNKMISVDKMLLRKIFESLQGESRLFETADKLNEFLDEVLTNSAA
ncbi:phospholipase D family protein [Acidocella sp.]|uniref:phospholipase D family protein n=1 Tax=Acidocella sp. TaxID=50710 RepID=UPI002632C83C|nr:phospholipase D family protein [Acidocella sp.]